MLNQTDTLASPATKKRGPGRPRRVARPPEAEAAGDAPTEAPPHAAVPPAPRHNKTADVIARLSRPEGATLAELITATGWLPHTTRAALTGLRKKGHQVERFKRGDATCYRIVGAAQ